MKKLLLALFQLVVASASAQYLQAGFDKAEYEELMKVSARSTADAAYYDSIPAPEHFKMLYQSPVMGMDNLWDLWKDEHNVAAISIRGTTVNAVSWLGNFYCAMVPAKGEMQVTKDYLFKYQLATNPKAAVHVGWLLSLAYLSKDMLPKIDSLYNSGVKDIVIMGHSQGGAIAFLLTSYLHYLQEQRLLPTDIRFKTYCSAGPKPGNLYFAYDYQAITQNGWAYNVVNSADWVPQTPFSIQTMNDFNATNPFINAKEMMKKQGFVKGLALRYVYNQMDGITKKAVNRYIKNLGDMVGGMLKKTMPGYKAPRYYESMNYATAGNQIVLQADEAYYKLFPDNDKTIFVHHLHKPYLYLLKKMK